ncbi:dual 3',5'-cyclic-AMP and -GMP phosphodiesterase 11-like isoform X3 [Clytia hemisphaerica]|uniref:dual 3',5'-cyclic-AMP and -GMP phosphodiesterase 11-like isoform X3 n=1 Tax=Clytia hemisphaerica TaxID=252671 RepID=UPI0034D5DB61
MVSIWRQLKCGGGGRNMNTSEEDLNSKFFGKDSDSISSDETLAPEQVEAWLDKHEDFVASYYARKASKFLLDAFLRTKTSNRPASRTGSPLPFGSSGSAIDIGRNASPLAYGGNAPASGCSTPRKSSVDTTSGLLKPLISHIDGIPSFIRFERSLSRPRHRKSKEELKELRLVDEQALLMELATDIANDLEITSLCHKILQNVSILTDGDRCSLFMAQDYGPNGQKVLVSKVYDVNADSSVEEVTDKETIMVPWGCGIVGWVAENGKTLNIPDAYSDDRFNKDIDKKTGYYTKSILCMPIKANVDEDGNSEVIAVAQVMNKQGATLNHAFTREDEKIFERYLVFCGIGICNAHLFDQLQQELKRNRVLLDLARAIFEEQSTLHDVVHKIMMNTQSLLQCERCSVLLVDPSAKGLFSKAFDLEARYYIDENGSVERKQSCGSSEVRFPINIGITGTVATTGETLNIPDAYEDPRFDPSVDGGSGFKTRTILCMPIKNSKGDIIGVVQLLNKMDGKPFNPNDENLFEAFAIFCGMAIHNTYIYEECVKANARQKIALDVLSYHATASDNESVHLVREIVPSSRTFHLREFNFDDAVLSDRETCLATIRMFQDLRLIQRFRIDYNVLCNWVLTVKKNYRNVIYHNWRHAFNVAQSMFLFLKELQEFKVHFTDEEKLALLVGCLCHDLDHRGTNNTFQVKSASPLAQLYGTSVMEHHHFDHCIMILHSSGNEIFNTLSPEEYNLTINVLEHAILSTDLALYFTKRNDYKAMVTNQSFEWEDNSKRSLLRSMLMTACDISAICKPWKVQQRVAHLVAEEFFQQGDLELKKLNMTPIEMMDRAKKDKLPQMQVGFIDGVCLPIYETLSTHYPYFKPLLDECLNNRKHWKTLADDNIKRQGNKKIEEIVD